MANVCLWYNSFGVDLSEKERPHYGGHRKRLRERFLKAAATLYLQQEGEGRDSLADLMRLTDFWRMRIGPLQKDCDLRSLCQADGIIPWIETESVRRTRP